MPRADKWRCGRARNHLDDHGDWVLKEQYKQEKWRCGVVASAPKASRMGIRFSCPWEGCEFLHPDSGPARSHWYSHIVEQSKVFDSTHGTEAGYQYHKKQLKEDACDECAKAHRVHNREWARQWRQGSNMGIKSGGMDYKNHDR